jgi:hypothetical protein
MQGATMARRSSARQAPVAAAFVKMKFGVRFQKYENSGNISGPAIGSGSISFGRHELRFG